MRIRFIFPALAALLLTGLAFRAVAGALLIRLAFELDARRTKRLMRRHAAAGVSVARGIAYSDEAKQTRLDLYRREDANGPQPTIVWVHGGAWLSGHRDDAAPYFTLLADAGYTVVSVGYSRAPARRYPTPVRQVTMALQYVTEQADDLGIDPQRIALAGDSAGAQIVSQVAAMIANPEFAAQVGVPVRVDPGALRAIVLHCGIYDLPRFLAVTDLPSRLLRWGVVETVRAYTGSRDSETQAARQMSTIEQITAGYPPAFISGGNGDRLTDTQSRPFAAALVAKGVEVETLFFAADREPALPHEYQFNLDTEAGQDSLDKTLAFLGRHLSSASEPAGRVV